MSDSWAKWREETELTDYDARWRRMAERGDNPHGEADFVCRYDPRSVLDAGCGTGRVAVELVRRGIDSIGVDSDQDMIAAARSKDAAITWMAINLAHLRLDRRFDVVVMAGNVIIFAKPVDRPAVIERCAAHVAPEGVLIAGFQLRSNGPTLADYDAWCAAAGLELGERFATWNGDPFHAGNGDYAVSVHRHRAATCA